MRHPRNHRLGAPVASVVLGLLVLSIVGPSRSATLDIIPDCQSARVARDASGVVGVTFRYPEGYHVVRWTPDRTIRRYPVDETFAKVDAVAQGGTVAIGGYVVGTDPLIGPYEQRSRWTERAGVEILPHFIPTTRARYAPASLSGDGRVAVGGQMGFPSVATVPVRWIGGVVDSPFLPLPGQFSTGAIVATNWTGSVAWGWLSNGGIFGPFDYYRWTAQSGGQWIPHPSGLGNSDLLAVVPEANVFIARGTDSSGEYRTFFLSPSGAIAYTPQPATGAFLPFYSTADLQTLLGTVSVRATRWTSTGGFRDVTDWITQDLGLNLDGWQLSWATGMSADGRVLTLDASKLYPVPGTSGSWVLGCVIVQVPEPSAALSLTLGIAWLAGLSKMRGAS